MFSPTPFFYQNPLSKAGFRIENVCFELLGVTQTGCSWNRISNHTRMVETSRKGKKIVTISIFIRYLETVGSIDDDL